MVWPLVLHAGRIAVPWVIKQAIKRPLTSLTLAHIVSDGQSTKALRSGIETSVNAGLDRLSPEAVDAVKNGTASAARSTLSAVSEIGQEGVGLAHDLITKDRSADNDRAVTPVSTDLCTMQGTEDREISSVFNTVSEAIKNKNLQLSAPKKLLFNALSGASSFFSVFGKSNSISTAFQSAAIGLAGQEIQKQLCSAPAFNP